MKRAIVPAIRTAHDTMNDQQYLHYVRQQWTDFANTLEQRTHSLDREHPLRELAHRFCAVANGEEDLYDTGPALVMRLFTHHPEFAPTLPRNLLWFLGGDCLHVLSDAEISGFQALEEERLAAAAAGDCLDWETAARRHLPLP